jgi:hypothetical protein
MGWLEGAGSTLGSVQMRANVAIPEIVEADELG